MNNQNSANIPANIREIVNARLTNPKFVFDGKRVQPVYERRCCDYAPGILYARHTAPIPMHVDPRFDMSSQILSLRTPSACSVTECAMTAFVHSSANKVRSPVNAAVWSPDGRRLLTGSNSGEITLWNGFSFNFDTILQAHEAPVRAMAWAPSGAFLVTGDSLGLVKYWHPSMNNVQRVEAHAEGVRDVSFAHSDARYCTASDDATIRIWDSARSACERVLRGHNWDVRRAQWHPRLAVVASGGKDNLVKLWDPRQEECLATFHYHKSTVLSMCFHGEHGLLTGGKDQVAKMLDLRTMSERITYKNRGHDVTALAVHPFSEMFAAGGHDGHINFWDPLHAEPLAAAPNHHEGAVWALDFHPAGHLLASGAADSTCKFWVRPRPADVEAELEAEIGEVAAEEAQAIPGLRFVGRESECGGLY